MWLTASLVLMNCPDKEGVESGGHAAGNKAATGRPSAIRGIMVPSLTDRSPARPFMTARLAVWWDGSSFVESSQRAATG